jgi:DNA-binding response OmpR family regulator
MTPPGTGSAGRRCFAGLTLGRLNVNRILVVEDENSLAMEISWILEDAGYSVVGPEASVKTTLQVLARLKIDLALLDVNLGGETVFPVSTMLDALEVPYIFITSIEASSIPAEYRHRPLVAKPYSPKVLLALIREILEARAKAACQALREPG